MLEKVLERLDLAGGKMGRVTMSQDARTNEFVCVAQAVINGRRAKASGVGTTPEMALERAIEGLAELGGM